MAERRIVVVSEIAPRMDKCTTEAARKFLREYFSYQNRVDENEVVLPMKVLIDPHELDILRACFLSEGWCRLLERRTTAIGVAQERRRAALQTPMTPAVLSASFDREVDYSPSVEPERKEGVKFESVKSETKAEERSEDELKSSVLQQAAALKSGAGEVITGLEDPLLCVDESMEALPQIVPLSNAHVELMLVQVLGPRNTADEVLEILKAVKMPKDANATLVMP